MISITNKILSFRSLMRINELSRRQYHVPRRALMYVPGDDMKKLNKAFGLTVDCIAMDCEDGVAINRKEDARNTIRSVLDRGKPQKDHNYDFAVRINSIQSGLAEKDLNTILTAKYLPDTILLPKVDSSDHIKWVSKFMYQVSQRISSEAKVNLIIYIESAVSFTNLNDICKTAVDFSAVGKFTPSTLVFGSDDFCASIGATRTESSLEILYARQKLVLAAKAFGMQAIDMVYIKYKDLEGLKQQSLEGARMGYTGKQIIHPGQIDIVQQAFLPSEEQIKWATGLLKDFEVYQKTGKGAFTYEGSMIDMPTVKQAQNIMTLVNMS